MANLLDYLSWRGDLTFRAAPFQDVDNVILCCLSYIGFNRAARWEQGETVTLAQAAQWLQAQPEEDQRIRTPLDRMLLHLAGNSARFRDVVLTRYVDKFNPEQELQFSAITFLLDEKTAYVAFRGTDNTLVGWKEDFNMTFLPQIPAQLEAQAYLNTMEDLPQRELLVGGHSKGGNLAVFAAAKAYLQVQDRITTVYTNDGPGFGRDFLDSAQYQRISGQIRALAPQTSVIGRLLEHGAEYQVVHSSESGIQQHDPYSWEVLGADFISEDGMTAASQVIDQSLKTWMEEMTPQERREFVDLVYSAMRSTNAETLREFNESWARNSAQLLRAWRTAPQETRRFMSASVGKLFGSLRSALSQQLKARGEERFAGWEEILDESLGRLERARQEEEPETEAAEEGGPAPGAAADQKPHA